MEASSAAQVKDQYVQELQQMFSLDLFPNDPVKTQFQSLGKDYEKERDFLTEDRFFFYALHVNTLMRNTMSQEPSFYNRVYSIFQEHFPQTVFPWEMINTPFYVFDKKREAAHICMKKFQALTRVYSQTQPAKLKELSKIYPFIAKRMNCCDEYFPTSNGEDYRQGASSSEEGHVHSHIYLAHSMGVNETFLSTAVTRLALFVGGIVKETLSHPQFTTPVIPHNSFWNRCLEDVPEVEYLFSSQPSGAGGTVKDWIFWRRYTPSQAVGAIRIKLGNDPLIVNFNLAKREPISGEDVVRIAQEMEKWLDNDPTAAVSCSNILKALKTALIPGSQQVRLLSDLSKYAFMIVEARTQLALKPT